MLFTVLKKEGKQLLSDKGFILIALVQPIILIIMFGSSFQSGDINHLRTDVIDLDNTTYSNYVVQSTNKSEFFDIVNISSSLNESLDRLNKSKIRAIVVIPKGFQENIDNTTPGTIHIYLDSSNFLTFRALSGAKVEIIKDTLVNITLDILGEVEVEKDIQKQKVEDIKEIFKDIEKQGDSLENDLDELNNLTKDSDSTNLNQKVNNLKTNLRSQRNSLNDSITAMDAMMYLLNQIQTLNESEAIKKSDLLISMNQFSQNLKNSQNTLDSNINEIDNINIASLNTNSKDITDRVDIKLKKIQNSIQKVNNLSKQINLEFEKLKKNFLSEPLKIEENAIYGDLRYFDYLSAGVLSLIVFFVCLMIPVLNIISEKEENTLYRLSTTPASSFTIFFGKYFLFMLFGFIEMAYTFFIAVLLYGMRISGPVLDSLIVLTLLASSSVSIGLFISSKIKTMQMALVIVPVIVIPSFLISNAFFPPDIMAHYMSYVSYITPMTYSNHALNAIMVKGFVLKDVLFDVCALIGFTLVPLVLFILSYRKLKY